MKYIALISFFFLATGVMLGAFGAHALQDKLDGHSLEVFHTGVRYQFLQALGLLGVVALSRSLGGDAYATACWVLVVGTVLFCGALYGVSLLGIKKLGMVAPIGGLSMIAGWLWMMKLTWSLWTS